MPGGQFLRARSVWGLQAPEHQGSAVAIFKFAQIFEPGVPPFRFAASFVNSVAGPVESLTSSFHYVSFQGLGIHPDGETESPVFCPVVELVKVMGTAWWQLVQRSCRPLASGLRAARLCFVHTVSCSSPSWSGLRAARVGVGVCGGHLTAQVQVQGLKDSS